MSVWVSPDTLVSSQTLYMRLIRFTGLFQLSPSEWGCVYVLPSDEGALPGAGSQLVS